MRTGDRRGCVRRSEAGIFPAISSAVEGATRFWLSQGGGAEGTPGRHSHGLLSGEWVGGGNGGEDSRENGDIAEESLAGGAGRGFGEQEKDLRGEMVGFTLKSKISVFSIRRSEIEVEDVGEVEGGIDCWI